MKQIKPSYFVLSFLFTAALVSLGYFIGYSSGAAAPPSQAEINAATAKTYTKRYIDTEPAPYSGVVNGLVVDKSQYDAMGQILQANPDAQAFRIYYGIDNSNRYARIVVGVNGNGSDLTNKILSTTPWLSGLCPPVCDQSGGLLPD